MGSIIQVAPLILNVEWQSIDQVKLKAPGQSCLWNYCAIQHLRTSTLPFTLKNILNPVQAGLLQKNISWAIIWGRIPSKIKPFRRYKFEWLFYLHQNLHYKSQVDLLKKFLVVPISLFKHFFKIINLTIPVIKNDGWFSRPLNATYILNQFPFK